MLKSRVNLLVALPAEARPINRLFGLNRRQPEGLLPLYTGDAVALVVSGPGLSAAQMAVDYLHRVNQASQPAWLNIGIAGHAHYPLGAAVLASQVRAAETNQHWRLTPPKNLGALIGPVQTVAQPASDYSGDFCYDMEAAGFVASAQKYASLEKIQALKIISDNRLNPSTAINAKMVQSLIQAQSELIRQLLIQMRSGAEMHP